MASQAKTLVQAPETNPIHYSLDLPPLPPYQPFDRLDFNEHTCFLSGEKESVKVVSAFPKWLLDQYDLSGKPFKLLDETIITYQDIKVPCSEHSLQAINELESTIQKAFNEGYAATEVLDRLKLFQWISKLVYGIIYHEIRTGIRQQAMIGEKMNFSQSLLHKFGNFHLMLQSLIKPIIIEGALPWSIIVVPVANDADTFSYRDEINTLTFSLRMKDFGIIACLQDNGANEVYNRKVLNQIKNKILHPIQFEELCAHFFYSSYLFNRLPEYTILNTPEETYIEAMPLRGVSSKPLFDQWIGKTYGQVLENFWKPWGLLLFEIIKDPENPKSFLFDENGGWVDYSRIPSLLSID